MGREVIAGDRRDAGPAHGAEAGQTLVEFALGLLVLLLLILGVVDFGRAISARNTLASAAREGARFAAVRPKATEAEVVAATKAMLGVLDVDTVGVNVSYPVAREVQVEVSYTYHAVTPLIGQLVEGPSGTGLVLTSRSRMRLEMERED